MMPNLLGIDPNAKELEQTGQDNQSLIDRMRVVSVGYHVASFHPSCAHCLTG
jgi:hypothetical protein